MIYAVFFFLLFPPITFADFSGEVVHIADGDTIAVLNDAKDQVKIRLNGIDCPEAGQAYGNKAKEFTRKLVLGETVTVQSYDVDKYSRTIGDVILEDGRNLSQELIKAGMAWWFFKYSDDERLGMLEVQAKIRKVGLWKDKNPIPPWIFREHTEIFKVESLPPKARSSCVDLSVSLNELPIFGNKRSKKYHRSDCPSYCDIAEHNQVIFESPMKAEEAGYELAVNCP